MLRIEKGMSDIRFELDQLRNAIGMGKDKIMRQYLGQKECRKLMDIVEMEKVCVEITKFAKDMQHVLKFKNKLQMVR